MSYINRHSGRQVLKIGVTALLIITSLHLTPLIPSSAQTSEPASPETHSGQTTRPNRLYLPITHQGQSGNTPQPSKVAYIIEERVRLIESALASGRTSQLSAQTAQRLSDDLLRVSQSGEILVELHAAREITPADIAGLTASGARIVNSTADLSWPAGVAKPTNLGVITAWVPYKQIALVAQKMAWVAAITTVEDSAPDVEDVGSVNSEGVALHNADDLQAAGVNGAGVNIGVISDGVSNLAASQMLGDLPAGVTVLNIGSGDEGTAMLEIIQDMAPGAALFFAATGGGTVNHIAAQNNLVAAGVNVIAEDIPFDTEPSFQRGAVAVNGDNIANAGVAMHSSAGNLAARHAARAAAVGTGNGPDGFNGPFVGCPANPTNAVAIAPNNDTTFDVTIPSGTTASFTLQWSEPRAIFPTAGAGGFTNLDLFIMNGAGNQCLGQSLTVQANGAGDTIEQIVIPAPVVNTAAKIVVNVTGGGGPQGAPTIDLRWRGANAVDVTTRAGSLNPDSNYLGPATAAAAANAGASTNLSTVALRNFSGAGPIQLFSTTICPGVYPCPGASVAGPAATTRIAPDWTGADGVVVTGVGGFGSPFSGTSAAAPHAAACDVLVRDSLNAAATVALVTTQLRAGAVDRDAAGTDNDWGIGVLDCYRAVFPTARTGGPYVTSEGNDITLNGSASSAPGGGALVYAWDLDNDGSFETAGATPTFDQVGQDGIFTVRLRVTDVNNLSDIATTTVTVINVAPIVTLNSNSPRDENSPITVSGLVSDPGWLDPLSATIDWGDGTPIQTIAGALENTRPDATLTFNTTHTYGDNGTFTIQVCGSDDDTTTCQTLPLVINNVAPTAEIEETGTRLINGIPTFFGRANQIDDKLTIRGGSKDPGSDDLTFTWDYDLSDGLQAEHVLIYLVNPPNTDPFPSPSIQPREVLDGPTHHFVGICHFIVTLAVDDDDGGKNTDQTHVVIVGTAKSTRSADAWAEQFAAAHGVDQDKLKRMLSVVSHMSLVFDEARDASTIEKALAVLIPDEHLATTRDHLDRQLLAAWLNFANGAIGYDDLIDTDGDGHDDLPFHEVMAHAESVRLNPASTDHDLEAQIAILEQINH